MTELQQKQLAFLEETISFYNLEKRCIVANNCVYYAPGQAGCAIGRHILDKELCRQLDTGFINTGVSNNEVFNLLPENLKKLTQEFLRVMQNLHDCVDNWTETGLSEQGINEVGYIKHYFNLY